VQLLALLILLALPSPVEVADTVQPDRVADAVARLAGEEPVNGALLVSRHIQHDDHFGAAGWIEDELAGLPGVEVWREPLTVQGVQTWNVVADLVGDDPDGPWLLLGAHYDSTASAEPGWDPGTTRAPGADDDASGVSVVLEAARVLSSWQPGYARNVRFVLFTAEEVGLYGSEHHVAELDVPIELALIFDPVGYNPGGGDLLWAAFDARWPTPGDAIEETGLELGSFLDIRAVDQDALGGDSYSDHYPFWQDDIPALHVGSFPMPAQNHTSGDTFDLVDVAFMSEVGSVASAFASEWAQPLDEEEEGAGCGGCGASTPGRQRPGIALLLLVALAGCGCRRR
jgi:hypothetical protein